MPAILASRYFVIPFSSMVLNRVCNILSLSPHIEVNRGCNNSMFSVYYYCRYDNTIWREYISDIGIIKCIIGQNTGTNVHYRRSGLMANLISSSELRTRVFMGKGVGETNKAYAKRLDISENTLAKVLYKQKAYPTLETLAPIVENLGYDWNVFLGTSYQAGEQRTQQYAELAEQSHLSEEGVTAIKGSDPYIIAFFESLLLNEEMNKLVWEYRQCYLQVQRYADFLRNEGLRAVFREVYTLAGVNITDSFAEFKTALFKEREKPLNLPPDLPQEDESLKAILNAFYAVRLLNSREKDIETELFDVLHRFIEKSEEVAKQELERQNRQAIEITGKPYPEEWK